MSGKISSRGSSELEPTSNTVFLVDGKSHTIFYALAPIIGALSEPLTMVEFVPGGKMDVRQNSYSPNHNIAKNFEI